MIWRKSSYSESAGACVEVADDGDDRFVRDSKDPGGPRLRFPRAAWAAFVHGVTEGEFDAPT